jgi:hypothetical protein
MTTQEDTGNSHEHDDEQEQEEQKQKILGTFNMSEIEKEIDKDSLYVKMEAGDKKTLRFNENDEIEKIESEFEGKKSLRYRLKVVDVNTGTKKSWTVSRTLLEQINDYVKEGIYTLGFTRKGTGKSTRYVIIPVVGDEKNAHDQ